MGSTQSIKVDRILLAPRHGQKSVRRPTTEPLPESDEPRLLQPPVETRPRQPSTHGRFLIVVIVSRLNSRTKRNSLRNFSLRARTRAIHAASHGRALPLIRSRSSSAFFITVKKSLDFRITCVARWKSNWQFTSPQPGGQESKATVGKFSIVTFISFRIEVDFNFSDFTRAAVFALPWPRILVLISLANFAKEICWSSSFARIVFTYGEISTRVH